MKTKESSKATIEKVRDMVAGKVAIMSDDELDTITLLDVSNVIRSRPNPAVCGTKDTWECWIEQKDLKRFN